MQKRILCFGDSNTWGYIPTGGRYDEHTRWPMRLGELLGPGYAVVEEGFHGRTCVMDDPVEGGFKSAVRYLPPCLMSHNPLDQVLVMLGSNDAKRRFGLTPMTIGQSMAQVVRTIKSYGADELGNPPHIVIIAPPPFLATPSASASRPSPSPGTWCRSCAASASCCGWISSTPPPTPRSPASTPST